MTLVRDLSGNGKGAEINEANVGLLVLTSDVAISKAGFLRVGTAGNLIMRSGTNGTDVTVPAAANEYVPVAGGTIVRSTSTAANVQYIRN